MNRKPPPIMISGMKDYNVLYKTVGEHVQSEFTIKLLNTEVYKINTSNSTDYRNLTAFLSTSKAIWYTYQDKQSRPIRVIVKDLHHSCLAVDIVDDLKRKGFKIMNAVNKLQYRTKKPLDIFMLTFEPTEDVTKIYGIRSILNSIVKVEPVKNSPLIPQCKKCQSFGHTKNYCSKQARCVKCAGKHDAVNCVLQRTDPPKCCNCGEKHPANYRGCAVAKELQKMRDQRKKELRPNTNKRQINSAMNTQPTSTRTASAAVGTYSEMVRGPKTNPNESDNDTSVMALLKAMMSQQSIFNKQLEQRLAVIETRLSIEYDCE